MKEREMTLAKPEDEMNLYEVHCAIKSGAAVHLLYRSKDRAMFAVDALTNLRPVENVDQRRGIGAGSFWDPILRLEDDFGSIAIVALEDVSLAWFDDMARNSEGQGEKQLFVARANVRLQKKAEQDQVLRSASRPSPIIPAAPLSGLRDSTTTRQ